MNEIVTTTSPSEQQNKRHYVYLFAVLALAAVLRISLALWLPSDPVWRDGVSSYQRIAKYILSEGQYPLDNHTLRSPPIQTLILASIYKLFGFNGTAARIVIALFGTFTCGILFLLGKKLFGKKVGIVAALLLAIYPLHIYISSLYEVPQTIFVFLLYLAVYQLITFHMSRSRFRLILSGFLFGLAVLTVPTIITALPFVAIWLLFIRKNSFQSNALNLTLFTIICAFVVLSWSAYIYSVTGRFQIGSGAGSETLFKGNCSLAWPIGKADIADIYEKEGVPDKYKDAYEEYQAVENEASSLPGGELRDAVYIDAVKHFFIERPKEAVMLLLRKAILYWCPYAMTITKSDHNNNFTKIIQIISFAPIFILALFGISSQRNKINILMPLYIIILSQWFTYTIFIVTARYRFHIDSFLIILATPILIKITPRIKESTIYE